MSVRIGVDVGGTFTKAVACDPTGAVVARQVLPTTHTSDLGVAEGVIEVVSSVLDEVTERGLGPASLIAYSTTQAVNSLLEGDTATVGILGIGAGHDAGRARSRTKVGTIGIAPGRELRTVHTFVDATEGFDASMAREAIQSLIERGAGSLAVSASFGVDDASAEITALEVAAELGLPACAGHELTGVYGLQLRTVTAALNASILPTALRAATAVHDVATKRAPGVPLLVMRGDGGAAALDSIGRRPLLTAFSGPAASVAGALRYLALRDAVIIEVGGTSTNVSVVSGGRPVLAYVRILRHLTSVRSLDVRVAGVAGGSLLRVRGRRGRRKLAGVGPRSAHIAGLRYCAFSEGSLEGARVAEIAPREGDPPEYLAIECTDGTRLAPTLTCAANALGAVPEGATARAGDTTAARQAFELLGTYLRKPADVVAREAIAMAAQAVCGSVRDLVAEHGLTEPVIVGVGGGAGALVPGVADQLKADFTIPADADVISSIGDALSMIRVETERVITEDSEAEISLMIREAEQAAVAAGAEPSSVQIETRSLPDRSTLRVTALGAVAYQGTHTDDLVADDVREAAATAITGPGPITLATDEFFSVFSADAPEDAERPVAIVDRWGAVAWSGATRPILATGRTLADELPRLIEGGSRRVGPITVAPTLLLLRGARLIDLGLFSRVDALTAAAIEECSIAGDEPVVVLLARSH